MAEPKIDYTGGSVKYTYTLPCGGSKNVTVEKEGQSSIDANVQGSGTRNGSITITAPLNTSLSDVNEKFKVSLDGNHCTDIEVTQDPYDCSCNNILTWRDDVINLINDDTDIPSNTVIATYKNESEECIKVPDVFNVTATSGGNNLDISINGGEVKIVPEIKRNKTVSNIDFAFHSTLNGSNCGDKSATRKAYECKCTPTVESFQWLPDDGGDLNIIAEDSFTGIMSGSRLAKYKYEDGVQGCKINVGVLRNGSYLSLNESTNPDSDGYYYVFLGESILPNETEDEVKYVFSYGLYGKDENCQTIPISQGGCDCSKLNQTETVLINKDSLETSSSKQTGITVAEVSLLSNSCYGSFDVVITDSSGRTFNAHLVKNERNKFNVILDTEIPENETKKTDSYDGHLDFTLHIKVDGADCKILTWQQQSSYVKCTCKQRDSGEPTIIKNNEVSFTVNPIPQTGLSVGTPIGYFEINREKCKTELTAYLNEDSLDIEWDGMVGNLKLTVEIEPNTDFEEKEFVLKIFHNGDYGLEECDTEHNTVKQKGKIPCTCEGNLINSITSIYGIDDDNLVPNTGHVDPSKSIVSVILDLDAIECSESLNAILYEQVNSSWTNYGYMLKLGTDTVIGKVDFSTYNPGDPTPEHGAKIRPNDDYPQKEFKVEVGFMQNNRFYKCDEIYMTQEGKVPCNCQGIGTFIDARYKHISIPQGGYSEWTQVASGDTAIRTNGGTGSIYKVCGALSGKSNVNWLQEDEQGRKVRVRSGRSDDLPSNFKDNLFFFDVKPRAYSPGEGSDFIKGTITLSFIKYNDDGTEEVFNCDGESIELEYSLCECQIKKLRFPSSVTVPNKKTDSYVIYHTAVDNVDDFIFLADFVNISPMPTDAIKNIKLDYGDELSNRWKITIDVNKDADESQTTVLGNLVLHGICDPQFTSEDHNSDTYIEGSGFPVKNIVCYRPDDCYESDCSEQITIYQEPKIECNCMFINSEVNLDYSSYLRFYSDEHSQGTLKTADIAVVRNWDMVDFISNCLVLVFLRDDGDENYSIIYNSGSREPAGSDENNTYKPNDWLELWFEHSTSYHSIFEVWGRLLRDIPDEEVEFNVKVGYAVRNSDNELEVCKVVDFDVIVEVNICTDCDDFYQSLLDSRDIRLNFSCSNSCTVVNGWLQNCATFKLAYADADFNELTTEEGEALYDFTHSLSTSYYRSVGFSVRDRMPQTPQTMNLILTIADLNDPSNNTYRGSVCKKNLTVYVDACVECSGNECSEYLDLSNNFEFTYDHNRFYRSQADKADYNGEHFEIAYNEIPSEQNYPDFNDDVWFFFGYVATPIPSDMAACIRMNPNTSDQGNLHITPYTAYTRMVGETPIPLDEYEEGAVVGLYAEIAPYNDDDTIGLDFGIELINLQNGTFCRYGGNAAIISVKLYIIGKKYNGEQNT